MHGPEDVAEESDEGDEGAQRQAPPHDHEGADGQRHQLDERDRQLPGHAEQHGDEGGADGGLGELGHLLSERGDGPLL